MLAGYCGNYAAVLFLYTQIVMPKTKQQKAEMLGGLEDKLGNSKSVLLARFNGLKAAESRELKKKLKAENSEYLVAKKTLLTKALAAKDITGLSFKDIDGQLAVIFGYGDEVVPAKVSADFIKTSEGRMEFVSGWLNGELLSKEQVKNLASLPGKQELYAKLVGSINAPVSGFVNVLAGNLRGLVRVLSAIAEKQA